MIIDNRDYPTGVFYNPGEIEQNKIDHILYLKNSERHVRYKMFSGCIQLK